MSLTEYFCPGSYINRLINESILFKFFYFCLSESPLLSWFVAGWKFDLSWICQAPTRIKWLIIDSMTNYEWYLLGMQLMLELINDYLEKHFSMDC